METEIIDNKQYIKFSCKIGINSVGAGEAIIWVEKEELKKLLDPKLLCNHIFITCDENGNELVENKIFIKCYKCGYRP